MFQCLHSLPCRAHPPWPSTPPSCPGPLLWTPDASATAVLTQGCPASISDGTHPEPDGPTAISPAPAPSPSSELAQSPSFWLLGLKPVASFSPPPFSSHPTANASGNPVGFIFKKEPQFKPFPPPLLLRPGLGHRPLSLPDYGTRRCCDYQMTSHRFPVFMFNLPKSSLNTAARVLL